MPMKQDGLDEYRKEYNDMLLDKATGANGITQEKYITITVAKKDIDEARAYFARIGADLTAHFANLGSKCVPLNAVERLRILHDFYRPGDEAAFSFDMNRKRVWGMISVTILPGQRRAHGGSYQAGREICQSAFPQGLRQLYQGQHVLGADRAKPQSHAVRRCDSHSYR